MSSFIGRTRFFFLFWFGVESFDKYPIRLFFYLRELRMDHERYNGCGYGIRVRHCWVRLVWIGLELGVMMVEEPKGWERKKKKARRKHIKLEPKGCYSWSITCYIISGMEFLETSYEASQNYE